MIMVSTCSNYGLSDPNTLVDETFPLQPLSQYAESKIQAEKLVLAHRSDTCCTVLRLGTICGLSPRMRFDLLVSSSPPGIAHRVARSLSRSCALPWKSRSPVSPTLIATAPLRP
jgi:nucleoside-diphosphate-sugar epimerase